MSQSSLPEDDALMHRFDANSRRYRARDGIVAIAIAMIVLVVVGGTAISDAAERMRPGVQRDILTGIGKPAGWISGNLPIGPAVAKLTAPLSPDEDLSDGGGFVAQAPRAGTASAVPQVTPNQFSAASIGGPAPPKRPLRTLLVTGDSLSTPLDIELARKLTASDVRVIREPHLGTSISQTALVDWGRLSATQVSRHKPDAVVVFIGANDGFPMRDSQRRQVDCCDATWAAIYANRVRQMMTTYRRNGAARVYWITVPVVREAERQRIERVVNAAITVAAEAWRDSARVVDTVPVFTPDGRYRDSMPIGGEPTLVRQADGIHLNERGSALLADIVQERLASDFTF